MGTERKKCGICEEDYANTEERKPVMITLCGHTYCRSCLSQLEDEGKTICPSCRVDWSQLKAQELPMCFQLLTEEDVEKIKAEDERRKREEDREEDRLVLKLRLEKEEITHSEMRHTTKTSLVNVREKISAVRNFMESMTTYLVSLETYQSELTDLEKCLDQKLQQLQDDLLAVSEPETEPATRNDIVQVVPHNNLKLQMPNAPVSRISAVAKAFLSSCSYADDASFVKSFYNTLQKHCLEITNANCPRSLLASELFTDGGHWTVSSSTSLSEALRLLILTSLRPGAVKVVVEKPWAAADLMLFLRQVSTKKCELSLFFNDSFNFPSPQNVMADAQRLESLLEYNDRRITVTEYVGSISKEVARNLSMLKVPIVTVNVTSCEEMVAAGQTGAGRVVLHIKDGTNINVLSKLPTEGPYELHIFGSTDTNLYEMAPYLLNKSDRIRMPVRLHESNITEAELDRFFGWLRDIDRLPKQQISARELTFTMQSHAIDAAGQQRITERLESLRAARLITWE